MAWGPVTLDEGTGPTALLLHGQPGTGASWRPVVDLLRDDHRVLAPDRPGYGDNDAPATDFRGNAEAMAELLGARGAVPAVVVGHSWGGGVAIELARSFPEVVAGLVLVASVGTVGSVNLLDDLLAAPVVGDGLAALGLAVMGSALPWVRDRMDGLPGRWASWWRTALPDASMAGGTAGALGRVRRSVMVEQRALVAALPSLEGALAGVGVPAAVIAGTADVVVSPAAAAELAHAVTGATLELVDGVGHFVPRDAPAVIADTVRRLTRS